MNDVTELEVEPEVEAEVARKEPRPVRCGGCNRVIPRRKSKDTPMGVRCLLCADFEERIERDARNQNRR
jgi:hypothetical protein